ncbi:hypothetical protein ABMA28_017394 [Loxostege sticticalis]|uniref:RNase H type-1 domain-containing protein n=1 Tax=Loxostege sticticalis TaxID=481309 RepID=A0ABD0S2A6_LOXSC
MYVSGKNIEQLCLSLSSALSSLRIWLQNHGLNLSVNKSSVVLFSRMRCPPPISVYFDNRLIPVQSEAKFLGLILDAKLTGLSHMYYLTARCEKLLNILRCLAGVWWGAHPFSLKLIYNALIRSVLDYGTFFLEPCSVVGLHKLDVVQSKALRIVTGAMRSSPNNALQVECSEPPLKLRRQFLSDKYLFRAFQFRNHPLYSKLQQLSDYVYSDPYWYHKYPPCLVISFRKYISLQAPTHRSAFLPLFCSSFESLIVSPSIHFDLNIPKNSSSSFSDFKLALESYDWLDWHHIYCDASKHSPEGNVGIGVYHHQYRINQKIKFPPETSVFTGECFGLFKSLEYVLLFKLSKTVIFSDSKSAFQALAKFPFKSNTSFPLVIETRKLLEKCLSNGLQVVFAWIPSHSRIPGNEIADRLANDAVVSGDMFPYRNYSHDLVTLPKFYLRKSWNEDWNRSGQIKGKFYKNIQHDIPIKPWFFRTRLDKRATSSIIRMRLGHACVPAHLARLHIVDNDMCECGEEVGDINHILFSCQKYDRSFFISSLISLRIPFPTCIKCLLYDNDYDVYKCISLFLSKNDIKI